MNPLRGNLAIRERSNPFDASLRPTLRSLAGAIIQCAAPFLGAVSLRRLTTSAAPLFEYQPLKSSAEIMPIRRLCPYNGAASVRAGMAPRRRAKIHPPHRRPHLTTPNRLSPSDCNRFTAPI